MPVVNVSGAGSMVHKKADVAHDEHGAPSTMAFAQGSMGRTGRAGFGGKATGHAAGQHGGGGSGQQPDMVGSMMRGALRQQGVRSGQTETKHQLPTAEAIEDVPVQPPGPQQGGAKRPPEPWGKHTNVWGRAGGGI